MVISFVDPWDVLKIKNNIICIFIWSFYFVDVNVINSVFLCEYLEIMQFRATASSESSDWIPTAKSLEQIGLQN